MTAREAEVLVIGGGVVGLMTAWYLARDGVGVTLVDSRDFGTQASGANAGSIHLQIQYPEFVAYGEEWGRLYAPCLRLLKASLALWQELPGLLGENLDVKLAGGLVVATTDEQMRRIEAKARIEASEGVETRILDRGELRAVAPYLGPEAIGGGFCPMEGKANPLRATPAIAAAAARAGATLLRRTSVTGLEAVPGGFPLQVTVTEPIAPLIPHLVYSAAGKLSLKQVANGGCIIGGGWPARKRPGGGLVTDPRSLAGNMVMAAGVVPAMARVCALRSWTAWVNGTADWRPIIGEAPGVPGFFLALFPWVGFSAGPMTARITADLVQGRPPPLPLEGISVLRD